MTNELNRVLGNPDNIIMSDALKEVVEPYEALDQELLLDGHAFVCSLRSAVLLNQHDRMWKFVLEVPGLVFKDVLTATEILFSYDKILFANLQGLEFESENIDTQRVTLTFNEIFKVEEDKRE